MQAVCGWVKNIIYFMIFLAVVNNLLADSKYEKYIRFFCRDGTDPPGCKSAYRENASG